MTVFEGLAYWSMNVYNEIFYIFHPQMEMLVIFIILKFAKLSSDKKDVGKQNNCVFVNATEILHRLKALGHDGFL